MLRLDGAEHVGELFQLRRRLPVGRLENQDLAIVH